MNEQPTAPATAEQRSKQPEQPAMTGLRKRQQIQNTNKQIFVWLAVASVIISICLVALQFLGREFIFNQKIINKKTETNKTLVKNVESAKALKTNIDKLLADTSLSALKYEAQNTKTSSLSVILDALPTEGDPTSFANSLQSTIFPRSGVGIRELSTIAQGDGSYADSGAPTGANDPVTLPFSAGFDGDYNKVKQALVDISHVIRPINLTELSVKAGENGVLKVTIGGVTYYQPMRAVDVRKEPLTP